MAVIKIPTDSSDTDYRVSLELDGVELLFWFKWNFRDGAYYMSIYDINGDEIIAGRRIVNDTPLMRLVQDPRWPRGEIIAVALSTVDVEAEIDELGERVELTYTDALETALLRVSG